MSDPREMAERDREWKAMVAQLGKLPGDRERTDAFLADLEAQNEEDARNAVRDLSRAIYLVAQIPGALALLKRAIARAEEKVSRERRQGVPMHAVGGKR